MVAVNVPDAVDSQSIVEWARYMLSTASCLQGPLRGIVIDMTGEPGHETPSPLGAINVPQIHQKVEAIGRRAEIEGRAYATMTR